MLRLIVIIILYCNLLQAQKQDIFSDSFIASHIEQMNSENDVMIDFKYTPQFRIILKDLLNISWVESAVKISDYYFPLFEKKLAKYGLPNDLKYLPILESGLNPKAESSAGAMGLWQFMPATGEMMGLDSNSHVNLYYCPVANTDSAARYLKSLFKSYGDWKLVLSSYNYGLGNMGETIKKAGSRNYTDVYPYLPKETRAYVPKFLVLKYLVRYQDIYFKSKKRFKHKFSDLKQIRIAKQTTIQKLAASRGEDENFLRFSNPQLISEIIPKGTIIFLKTYESKRL